MPDGGRARVSRRSPRLPARSSSAGSASGSPASTIAMLTLAFAQIVWSIAFQWDDVTGGSNGIVGVWPAAVARRQGGLLLVRARARSRPALAAIAWIAHTPFGYSLRACRDSPLRAGRHRHRRPAARSGWRSRSPAAFAGLAGGTLRVLERQHLARRRSAIPRSVDALVMVLLGGLNALAGPLLGAAAFTWLAGYARARHRILARRARRRDPSSSSSPSDGNRRDDRSGGCARRPACDPTASS